MKICEVKRVFDGNNLYVKIITDEGIYGIGECTLNTRQLAVDGALQHIESLLIGKDPRKIEYIWQDIYRGTFWRGGPVLMSALSGIDMALWDIKGKALKTSVYNLLGGACRDKIKVYCHVGGYTFEEFAKNAIKRIEQGYKVLRICPHDIPGLIYEPGPLVRKSVQFMKQLRHVIGDDIEIIFEVHTRLTPTRAIELCNAIEEYRPLFVEDPTYSDSPEAYRVIREHTNVPLATGEKLGAKWDYKFLIENDMVDYIRTDLCSCGGISEARKIAAMAEVHYMEMAPHGVSSMVGMMTTLNFDLSVPNFQVQEFNYDSSKADNLDYEIKFEDGYVKIPDRPGLGIELDEHKTKSFIMAEHPHLSREDGTVQAW